MAALLGKFLGMGLWVLLWVATWDSAKKRKIGLSNTSYLALFLTPFIAYIVTLFTKKINKSKEQPTYQQRLPYENTTAMLIAAIIYIFFSIGALVAGIMGYMNNRSGLAGLANFVILLTWGISLFSERKELLLAKEHIGADENADLAQEAPGNCDALKPTFVFESNVQQRIMMGTENIDTSQSSRRIVVVHIGGDNYELSIMDVESGKFIMQSVPMHNASYSDLDECLSMESENNIVNCANRLCGKEFSNKFDKCPFCGTPVIKTQGEYTLNVFYKDEQVCKCVVYRKSKDLYIHYNKE